MSANVEQALHRAGIKIYPNADGVTVQSALSWTGDTPVSSVVNQREHDISELPPRAISSDDSGSVYSVMTEHYLDQIKDREERESVRRNIDFLREQGFQVRGSLIDGKYYVKFSTPARAEVVSLKSFIKAKISQLLQQK
jgi:hypothetical protein